MLAGKLVEMDQPADDGYRGVRGRMSGMNVRFVDRQRSMRWRTVQWMVMARPGVGGGLGQCRRPEAQPAMELGSRRYGSVEPSTKQQQYRTGL